MPCPQQCHATGLLDAKTVGWNQAVTPGGWAQVRPSHHWSEIFSTAQMAIVVSGELFESGTLDPGWQNTQNVIVRA